MAELNMNFNAAPVAPTPAQQINQTPDTTRVAPAAEERDRNADAAAAAEKVAVPVERQLDNVVSVSQDGDTVQASPASVDRLDTDASVRVVGNEQNQAAERTPRPEVDFRTEEETETALDRLEEDAERRAEVIEAGAEEAERRAAALAEANEAQAQASEDAAVNPAATERVSATPEDQGVRVDVGDNAPERQITSYAGISNQQLEQMYLQGTISKYDYDSEIASREERAEQAQANINEFTEEAASTVGVANQSQQNFNAVENAYTRDQTIDEARDATRRLEAMNTVQRVMTQ